MTPLFIIPARGGSKGIPKKNIKKLGGKPLIAYSIDTAKALAVDDDHIIISTDSTEIADTARRYGVKVEYVRPAQLATDSAGSREVILDAMDWAESKGILFDYVILLQPTSPLRTIEDVRRCMDAYRNTIDMAVTVKEASSNPYYNCFEADGVTGYLHISKGEGGYIRRQDAPKCYEYNGAVYAINPKSLREESMGKFKRIIPVEMAEERSVDIDTPIDWMIAESLIKKAALSCETSDITAPIN